MLCNCSPYLFCWEDRDGRILGASRKLQEEEGIQDPSEFIGKTEKEIACRFDADGLRLNQEELVLSGGRFRNVRTERKPWYREKEVAGTLVMLNGISEEAEDEESRLGLLDQETGFLSFRGAIEAGLLFADRYRLKREDYIGLLMDVPAFSAVMRDRSEDAETILMKLSEMLRSTFTSVWAIARIGLCSFLCFSQRSSLDKAQR